MIDSIDQDKTSGNDGDELGRILNRDFFLYLLDFEVKRARRYQNFLSILLLKLEKASSETNGEELMMCYKSLKELLVEEMRDTDILGSLGDDRFAALLPYADELSGNQAKSRLANVLKYCDFKSKGYDVTINQFGFPMNGSNAIDLIKKASATGNE